MEGGGDEKGEGGRKIGGRQAIRSLWSKRFLKVF